MAYIRVCLLSPRQCKPSARERPEQQFEGNVGPIRTRRERGRWWRGGGGGEGGGERGERRGGREGGREERREGRGGKEEESEIEKDRVRERRK